jgi:endonuclease G
MSTPPDNADDRASYRRSLASRAAESLKGTTLNQVLNRVRAIIGDEKAIEQEEMAREALEMLREGDVPSPTRLAALELVIRLMRPAPLSKGGTFQPLTKESAVLFHRWPDFQQSIKKFLYSIGRIDRGSAGSGAQKGVGTGFLVADDLILTNRHVLDLLSRGTFELEKGQAVVCFKCEYYENDDEPPVNVVSVEAVHPTLDMALLRLEATDFLGDRKPLRLSPAAVAEGEAVVAVGYPFNDERNPIFVTAIYGDRFGVKRAAPGIITAVRDGTLFHDCSTLNGNSGSPLLSMSDAGVVGLHREGKFTYRNEAVGVAALGEFVSPYLP